MQLEITRPAVYELSYPKKLTHLNPEETTKRLLPMWVQMGLVSLVGKGGNSPTTERKGLVKMREDACQYSAGI